MNLSVFLAILLDACMSAQNSGSFASSLNTLVREATSCVVLLAAAPEMVRWGADGTLPDDRCERGQRHSWALARVKNNISVFTTCNQDSRDISFGIHLMRSPNQFVVPLKENEQKYSFLKSDKLRKEFGNYTFKPFHKYTKNTASPLFLVTVHNLVKWHFSFYSYSCFIL